MIINIGMSLKKVIRTINTIVDLLKSKNKSTQNELNNVKREFKILKELKTNFERFGQTSESPEYYEKLCREFKKKPTPPGRVFNWVCRNNPTYLDLTMNRLELTPRQ